MKKEAIPEPSASILVIRDGRNGLEVLMMERPRKSSFAAGAYVFPGGRVERQDIAAARGFSVAPRARKEIAFRFAGLRELYEEASILIAEDRRGREIHARLRSRISADAGLFRALGQKGMALAPHLLTPFAHWITPAVSPRRFDTRFYLAALPKGQDFVHASSEAVKLLWARPLDLLDSHARQEIPLMFPTRLNLSKLSRAVSVADAIGKARRFPVVTVLPVLNGETGERTVHIPAAAGYGVTQVDRHAVIPDLARAVRR